MRGYSLAELVLAVGLVAVALLSLMSVFLSGVEMAGRSRDVNLATELARQTLEQLRFNVRKAGLDCIPAGTYSYDGRLPTPSTGAAPLQFPPAPYPGSGPFKVIVTGEELNPGRLKAVAVEVVWGASGRVRLETHLH